MENNSTRFNLPKNTQWFILSINGIWIVLTTLILLLGNAGNFLFPILYIAFAIALVINVLSFPLVVLNLLRALRPSANKSILMLSLLLIADFLQISAFLWLSVAISG